jgi:uncharacterized membrane protein
VITLFHIFAFCVSLVGLVLGAVFGSKLYGWVGGTLGAVVGAYLGLVLGRLPRAIAAFAIRRVDKKGQGSNPATPNQGK